MREAKFKTESEDLSVDWTKPCHVLSMGAGVQTTAQILRDPKRYKNGFIIFADTGDEKAETYYYVEKYLKPFCKEQGLRWVTVYQARGFTLMQWCMKWKIVPVRSRRWCTEDFKIKPIQRFLRHIGANKKHKIIEDIGISLDESHRMNFSKDNPKYMTVQYPLIDAKITRKQCYEIIKEHGFPVPEKSGCDFCMFAGKKEMRQLHADKPERFMKIVKMEENGRNYPRELLFGAKFGKLRVMTENQSLDSFSIDDDTESETCDDGHCFR